MTRVLVNAIHARAGGGLTYLKHLLPLLAAEPDLEVHVIPHPSQAENLAELTPALVLHHTAMPSSWFALLLWEQIVLPLVARRIGFDVLLSPANFGPLAARRQVTVLQNATSVGTREARLRRKLYWAALRIMTILSLVVVRRTVAVSNYVKATTVPRWLKRAPTVIYHGVAAEFTPHSAVAGRSPFLLAVGDLYTQKNLHRLIEALAVVRGRHSEITLRIAGRPIDLDYAAELHRLTKKLDLAHSVLFLGGCSGERLVELYRSCAAFVFPSTEESFGMPLVEAMACGAPIVASNSAATPEITGGAALLCNPEDSGDIARTILRVLEDPELAASLRRQSLDRARAFSWFDCAQRTAAVLRDVARWGRS